MSLGAFGKHPGWDDHIDDLGLETQRLVDLRALIYLEGIGQRIDTGAWEKLAPEQRLEAFAHVFAYRVGGDLLIGRFWASRDGKGRDRYPMVVAVHLTGAPLEWAVANVFPALERLESACKIVQTADGVIAAINAARAHLRTLLQGVKPADQELTIPRGILGLLADAPDMGPSRQGLYRVMYQLNRECSAYLLSAGEAAAGKSRLINMRAQSLRVPQSASSASAAIHTWICALLTQIEPAAKMLLIAPLEYGWVDVIIGEPSGAELFCIRASPESVPLTTSIPYSIDPVFTDQIDRQVEVSRSAPDTPISRSTSRPRSLGGVGTLFKPAMIALCASSAAWCTLCVQTHQAVASPPSALRAEQAGTPSNDPAPFQEPRVRYNAALDKLKAALSPPDLEDDLARLAVRNFISDVQSLPGGIAYLGSVESLLDRLADTAAGLAPTPPGTQVPRMPAGSTRASEPEASMQLLPKLYSATSKPWGTRFMPIDADAGLPTLDFLRLPGTQTLLLRSEVSIGDFTALLIATRALPELPVVMPPFEPADDPRRGIHAWRFSPAGPAALPAPKPAPAWFDRTNGPVGAAAYPPNLPSFPPQPPSARTPIQHVPAAAALLFATRMGCRLPTVGEFQAALRSPSASAAIANRRDPTFLNQQTYSIDASQHGGYVPSPALGAFVPDAVAAASDLGSTNILPDQDGFVWFRNVSPAGSLGEDSPDLGWSDLIGNVAEIVLDDAAARGMSDQGRAQVMSARELANWLDERPDAIRVIGSSALSDVGIDPATPYPAPWLSTGSGYADVGFRLALGPIATVSRLEGPAWVKGVGGGSGSRLSSQLGALLEPTPYLAPR